MKVVTREDLLKFAAEVRDMARHAAVAGPLHGKNEVESIESINLDALVDHFMGDGTLPPEGVELIAEERAHHFELKFSKRHDRQWSGGELAMAAACYAAPDRIYVRREYAAGVSFGDPFPFRERGEDARPYDGNVLIDRTDEQDFELLVKAGSLIAAELDRILATKKGLKIYRKIRERLPEDEAAE